MLGSAAASLNCSVPPPLELWVGQQELANQRAGAWRGATSGDAGKREREGWLGAAPIGWREAKSRAPYIYCAPTVCPHVPSYPSACISTSCRAARWRLSLRGWMPYPRTHNRVRSGAEIDLQPLLLPECRRRFLRHPPAPHPPQSSSLLSLPRDAPSPVLPIWKDG